MVDGKDERMLIHLPLADYWLSAPICEREQREKQLKRRMTVLAYSSFGMIQLDTTRKPALGEQADLGDEELVKLELGAAGQQKML